MHTLVQTPFDSPSLGFCAFDTDKPILQCFYAHTCNFDAIFSYLTCSNCKLPLPALNSLTPFLSHTFELRGGPAASALHNFQL